MGTTTLKWLSYQSANGGEIPEPSAEDAAAYGMALAKQWQDFGEATFANPKIHQYDDYLALATIAYGLALEGPQLIAALQNMANSARLGLVQAESRFVSSIHNLNRRLGLSQVGAANPKGFKPPPIDKFISGLKTRPTPANSPQDLFEIEHTGPVNYLAKGGNEEVWIDGIERSTATILESKMIKDPSRSPFISGSQIDPEIRHIILSQVRDEFRRINLVIQDPKNPFNKLKVITNNTDAKAYFESLMKELGIKGTVTIPGQKKNP